MDLDRYVEGKVDPTQPWNESMAPAAGTILKYELQPRNGRPRSIALEIEKNTRHYRIRARDYSRDKNIISKSLGLKCPSNCYSTDEAVSHLREHPEIWMFFEGWKETMEAGNWPKELRQKVVSRGVNAAARAFPHGSLGDMLRWYLKSPLGSEGQKQQFASNAREVLTLKRDRYEAFAHLDASDLSVSHVSEMLRQWQAEGKSMHTFRQACTLLSKGLNTACDRPEQTGCRRGPDYGIVVTDKMNLPSNPFNTVRRDLDAVIARNRMDDPDKGPDPFDHDECRAILTVFRKTPALRPYWPLVALCLSTGARPNEILALPWSNVLGLWKGYSMRSREFLVDPAERQLHGGPVMISRAVCKYNARHLMKTMRFKNTKNRNERRPKLNRYVPGYEDLFKSAIEARLPTRLGVTNLPEFRDMLVFQGPRSRSTRETYRTDPTTTRLIRSEHSPSGGSGSGNSRVAELHRFNERARTGQLTHHMIKPSLGADARATATPNFALLTGNNDPFLPFDWHNFARYWKQGLELAGVRYRSPYQMRHTYVSLMFYEGHADHDIAAWIGDTPQTMKERYQGRILRGNLDL